MSRRPGGSRAGRASGQETGTDMANKYDAIIIGGGHNGLTAGAYFSRAGAKTVVLEADDHVGGAADSSNPFKDHPDIKVSTYSYVVSLVPPTIINDLQLKKFG